MVPKVFIVMSLLLAVAFVMVSSAQVNAAEKPQVNEAVDAKEATETNGVNDALHGGGGYGRGGGYYPPRHGGGYYPPRHGGGGYCHRCCHYGRCRCCSLAEYNEMAAKAEPQN